MKKLISIILFILFSQGCGGGSSTEDISKSPGNSTEVEIIPIEYQSILYKNEIAQMSNSMFRGGITLDIPASWNQEENIEIVPPVLTTFYSVDNSPKVLTIVKTENFIQSRADLSNIRELSSQQIELSSFEGTEIIFTANIDNVPLKFMQSYIEVNSVYYSIFFFSEPKEFDKYIKIFRYITSTSHFSFSTHKTTDLNITKGDDDVLLLICDALEQNSNEYQLYGKIMNSDMTFTEKFLIDERSYGCANATAKYHKGTYLVVYAADYNDRHLVAKRVTKSGVVLDNIRIPISLDSEDIPIYLDRDFRLGNNHKDINIVHDGDKYIVIWRWAPIFGEHHIMGRYIDNNGSTSETFSIHEYIDDILDNTVKAAISNQHVLVTWSTKMSNSNDSSIITYGKLVDETEIIRKIEPSIIYENDESTSRLHHLIPIDNGFVFSWVEGENCDVCKGKSIKAKILNGDVSSINLNLSNKVITLADNVRLGRLANTIEENKVFFNVLNIDNRLLFSWISGELYQESIYHIVSDYNLIERSDIIVKDKKIGFLFNSSEIDVTYSENKLFIFQTAYKRSVVWAENKPSL